MRISVVVPVFNEEENIAPLVDELAALRERWPDLEAILVDDGSRDATWGRILQCAADRPWLRGLRSPANEGQTAAIMHGLARAAGEVIVTMDGDLQNDAADIPRLVGELGDADCVCGYRAARQDVWSKKAASRLANIVRNWVTRDGIRDTGCTLKAFRRACVEDLPPLAGVHRFMPAYFRLHGRRIKQIPVNHRARKHGTSKYTNLRRLPATLVDLLGFWWYRRRLLPRTDVETTPGR